MGCERQNSCKPVLSEYGDFVSERGGKSTCSLKMNTRIITIALICTTNARDGEIIYLK